MTITKEQKQQMVEGYVDRMSKSQAMIFTNYGGLTVTDMMAMRRKLREVGGVFQVVKNTLFARALEQAGIPIPSEQLQGPIAVGYCFEESPPVAKVMMGFAKETQGLQVRGAILGTKCIDFETVQALANLPPREVLWAQLLGTVQGPMSSLVGTITAPLRELVQVLQARSEQGQEAAA